MNFGNLKYIKRLVRLSNALDFVGEFKKASIIDEKIEKIAAKRKGKKNMDQLPLFEDLYSSDSDFEVSEEDKKEVDEIEEYFTEEYDFPTFENNSSLEHKDIPEMEEIRRKFENIDIDDSEEDNVRENLETDIDSFDLSTEYLDTSYELDSEQPLFGLEPEKKVNPAREYAKLLKELEDDYLDSEE